MWAEVQLDWFIYKQEEVTVLSDHSHHLGQVRVKRKRFARKMA